LHPFIPFFTEKVWLDLKFGNYFKSPLMFKDWNLLNIPNSSFNKSYQKIDWLIQLVTSIRSTKVDLDVSPGSFIDISTEELNKNKRSIIKDNSSVFKRVGRVSNIYDLKIDKNGIKIIVEGESITLHFDKNLDLVRQKQKISKKVKDLDQKVIGISGKLKNKYFLRNAPKQIVEKEKKALVDYKIELKKLNSILNSIKN
jgi:valyl-tRNA synthetase